MIAVALIIAFTTCTVQAQRIVFSTLAHMATATIGYKLLQKCGDAATAASFP